MVELVAVFVQSSQTIACVKTVSGQHEVVLALLTKAYISPLLYL